MGKGRPNGSENGSTWGRDERAKGIGWLRFGDVWLLEWEVADWPSFKKFGLCEPGQLTMWSFKCDSLTMLKPQ